MSDPLEDPTAPYFVPPQASIKNESGSADQSAGGLDDEEYRRSEVEIKAEYDRRIMRRIAFACIGLFAIFFLCLLPWILLIVFVANVIHGVNFSFDDLLITTSNLPKGAGSVAVLISILVVSATVPITLLLALVKLASSDGKSSGVSSPQWEAITAVISSFKDLMK